MTDEEKIEKKIKQALARPWYFTFGHGHKHHNHYVRIVGTFAEAREEMFNHFGAKWCFQYNTEEFEDIKKRWGYLELILPKIRESDEQK